MLRNVVADVVGLLAGGRELAGGSGGKSSSSFTGVVTWNGFCVIVLRPPLKLTNADKFD